MSPPNNPAVTVGGGTAIGSTTTTSTSSLTSTTTTSTSNGSGGVCFFSLLQRLNQLESNVSENKDFMQQVASAVYEDIVPRLQKLELTQVHSNSQPQHEHSDTQTQTHVVASPSPDKEPQQCSVLYFEPSLLGFESTNNSATDSLFPEIDAFLEDYTNSSNHSNSLHEAGTTINHTKQSNNNVAIRKTAEKSNKFKKRKQNDLDIVKIRFTTDKGSIFDCKCPSVSSFCCLLASSTTLILIVGVLFLRRQIEICTTVGERLANQRSCQADNDAV